MVFKFTIDRVVNKYVPGSIVPSLPKPIARFLGGHQPKPRDDYFVWLDVLLGSFCGIALIEGVFKSHTIFSDHNAPLIVASFGATAILCFNATAAPLSQPRNILFGHFVSALTGLCIQKLFSLSEAGKDHYWAAAALSVGVASVMMSIFNCVHPPAGASALLPSVDESIRAMGWWYLPVMLVSSVLIISVACITNNVLRQYPIFWWTPLKKEVPSVVEDKIESVPATTIETEAHVMEYEDCEKIEIGKDAIIAPKDFLTDYEITFLEELRLRLNSMETTVRSAV